MPIKGMTTRESVRPRFTRIGKIKKGKIENDRPVDLSYFRFVGEGADKHEVERVFGEAYGPEPRRVTVYLPHQAVDENWSTWMEEWGASGLIHRCDGEYMVRWLTEDKTYESDPDQSERKPCPYESGAKERTKKNPGCQPVGRLDVLIPELLEAGFIGYVTVELHSPNDLSNLTAALFDAEDKAAAAHRPNGLQGIQFVLRRQLEEIGVRYKNKSGEIIKTRGDKWMVRLDPSREWSLRQLETAKEMALGYQPEQPALPAIEGEIVDDEPFDPDPEADAQAVRDVSEQDRAEAGAQAERAALLAEAKHGGRPWRPEVLRAVIQDKINEKREAGWAYPDAETRESKRTAVRLNLGRMLGGDDDARHAVSDYLTGKQSSKDWDTAEIDVLRRWIKMQQGDDGNWYPSENATREAHAVAAQALKDAGQSELPW